ncbi:MAG: uL30 family ribosomal protein [Nanoarchaeota archaeon]|nr:uL30 family ribosomal protein [Nanoarchaeota archaeon]
MIAIIRIKGMVKINKKIVETLSRLRLRRKYSCVVIRENNVIKGMIKKVRDFVAYGEINDKTLAELINKRGQWINKEKKIDGEKIINEMKNEKIEKKWPEYNLKPFFRLHPPRKGIKSKIHFPKGVLGNNKEKINDLIMRML